MDFLTAIKRQHRLGLEMLCECVERCPDDLWLAGIHPRQFWRIAYHAAYYTDRYLSRDARRFSTTGIHTKDVQCLWGNPPETPVYTKAEVLAYLSSIQRKRDAAIDALDIDAEDSGFSIYKMPKAELLMLNLRHLQHHIGQLSELLMARGIDIEWAGMS